MKKLILIISLLVACTITQAQSFDCSVLLPENLTLLDINHTFTVPSGMRKKDVNNKPWALLKIRAKGFNDSILKYFNVYSPSSELTVEHVSFDSDDGCINIMLSSGVEDGVLIFKYQGTSLNYTIPNPLIASRVYQLDLALREANLTIIVTPEDATVTIDGEISERKGLANKLLHLGNHIYSIECENYLPITDKVIKLEKDEVINVSLKPLFGYITINSEPQGAEVFVDDVFCGTTPYINKIIKRGTSSVELRMPLYRNYSELVTVEAGESKELNIGMISKSSSVNFTNEAFLRGDLLEISADTLFFGPETSSDTVYVTTNSDDWSFDSVPNWCSVFHKNNMIIVTCHKNNVRQERSANILIYTQNQEKHLHVSQKLGDIVLKSHTNKILFDAKGDTVCKHIETNMLDWKIETNDTWVNAFERSDTLVVMCSENPYPVSRHGIIEVNAGSQSISIEVAQKSNTTVIITPSETVNDSTSDAQGKILINSKPSWEKIFIDGIYVGRSPVSVNIDDSVHTVRCLNENRAYIFGDRTKEIKFKQGMRYITVTTSGETFGIRSGFIGGGRWGAYTHFQMNLNNTDLVPDSDKNPFYDLSMGPTFEPTPWMSLYAGAGLGMLTDSVKQNFSGEVEAGIMFYYRRIFISGGVQTTQLFSGSPKTTFSAGLGLYFGRYYDKDYGYCADMSRQYWSLNILYNHIDNTIGLMFSDLGKGKVRGYIKVFGGSQQKNQIDIGLTGGCVFNMMGFIDMLAGVGYQCENADKVFSGKGVEAELGIVMNVWRIPITVMFRCNEVEKKTRYLSVDFGLGFSFGKNK